LSGEQGQFFKNALGNQKFSPWKKNIFTSRNFIFFLGKKIFLPWSFFSLFLSDKNRIIVIFSSIY